MNLMTWVGFCLLGVSPSLHWGLTVWWDKFIGSIFIRAQISLLQLSAFLDRPDLGDTADMPQRPCEKQWFLCHGCYFLCTDTSLLYIPGDQNCSNSVRVRGSCWGYYILQVLSVTNFGAFITRHLSDVKAPNWNNYTWK